MCRARTSARQLLQVVRLLLQALLLHQALPVQRGGLHGSNLP
jgi:hypothetical protein